MKKPEQKAVGEKIVTLTSDLLQTHVASIIEAHQKMDTVLSFNIRGSLKHVDGKISVGSTITYATDQTKDHADVVIDPNQLEIKFAETAA